MDDSPDWLSETVAGEDEYDSGVLLRLTSWAAAAAGAVALAILTHQWLGKLPRSAETIAALEQRSDLIQGKIQGTIREAQERNRRLDAAINALTADRDRLNARLARLEQGLDSVTGSIKRIDASRTEARATRPEPAAPPKTDKPPETVAATPEPPKPATAAIPPAPAAVPVASAAVAPTTPAWRDDGAAAKPSPPLMPPQSILAPPDASATRLKQPAPQAALIQPAVAEASDTTGSIAATMPGAPGMPTAIPVQRTDFGVDLGGASTIERLRVLWHRNLKANPEALADLYPIIVIREAPDGRATFRLVAGPLDDAAAAAKICAAFKPAYRGGSCETAIFDGQRLADRSAAGSNEKKPDGKKPEDNKTARKEARPSRHHAAPAEAKPENKPENKPAVRPERQSAAEPAAPEQRSVFASFFRRQ